MHRLRFLLLAEPERRNVETCLEQEEPEGMGAGFHLTVGADAGCVVSYENDTH